MKKCNAATSTSGAESSRAGARSQPKMLLVTNANEDEPAGGRALLSRLNRDVLFELYGSNLGIVELSKSPLRGAVSYVNAFRGYIDGLNPMVLDATLQMVRDNCYAKVFVDGSNLGLFVRRLRRELPHVEVITFFHNVESRFFWGAFRQSRTLRALAVLWVNYLAERRSVRCSSKVISLSRRDSALLCKIYGRAATHVSAIGLRDKAPASDGRAKEISRGRFALFVGGTFYANLAGITWFVDHVAPRIQIRVCVVGTGFEGLRDQLEREGKVEVIGAVDSVAPWYLDAHFAIAPIFDGSGMKTKVAEALMFGKKIVGTPEAFSGYEDVASRAGWVCKTADDFVAAIGEAENTIDDTKDPALREIYENTFSYSAFKERIAAIVQS